MSERNLGRLPSRQCQQRVEVAGEVADAAAVASESIARSRVRSGPVAAAGERVAASDEGVVAPAA